MPIAGFSGASLMDGLRAIVLFNQLVLAPIALICVYGITRTFASRSYAYLVSLAWVIAPVASFTTSWPTTTPATSTSRCPRSVGLTGLGDYPSMVMLLVATYFLLRAVSSGADISTQSQPASRSGSRSTSSPRTRCTYRAVVVALTRRPGSARSRDRRSDMVPSLIGLALWKYRGLGYLPAFASPSSVPPATIAPAFLGGIDLHQYVSLDWRHLHHNLDRHSRVHLEPANGLLGRARRARRPGATVVHDRRAHDDLAGDLPRDQGHLEPVDVLAGGFLTHLIAAFPPYFLLAISAPFLVPIYGRRAVPRRRTRNRARLPKIAVWVLGIVTGVGIVAVGLLPTFDTPAAAGDLSKPFPAVFGRFTVARPQREAAA